MNKRFNWFPWRIFWRFFFFQLIAFNILLFVIISVIDLRYQMRAFVYNEILLNFFVFSVFLSAATSYRFARPLRRVILKALRISRKTHHSDLYDPQEHDLLDDELDDLSEIDIALNHIHRKLKRRKAQLHQAREEAQAFFSAVSEGVVSIGVDSKISFFNSQFAAQFLTKEQVNHETLWLGDAIRAPEVLGGFDKALKQGKAQRFTVRLNTLVDNHPRYYMVSANPIRHTKTQAVYGVVGIFHDISDLKKAEQIRIDFVGNASHELRTPLTSIKGYVDTLKDDVASGNIEHASKFLQIVSKNIDRLIDLVNDLLSLSTMESQSELNLQWLNPLQLTELVISELAVLAAEKNINIQVYGDVPSFRADHRKVEQVLRNLISNALKYIPAKGTVAVRWETDGAELVLRVIDDGPGIPAEHLDRLFERFYRVDRGRTRDAGGTGLGLAIVKHIVQSHGGEVEAKSGQGGCEILCRFPLN